MPDMKVPQDSRPSIIVVLGPTASGKSDLAVKIAKWVKRKGKSAEIISADSRQVYRGLDLGSGKIARDRSNPHQMRTNGNRIFEKNSGGLAYYSGGVRHHMLDVAKPKRQYSVAQHQKSARTILYSLFTNHSLPILCGGTGQYIDALLYDYPIPEVKPNRALRARLEKKSTEALFAELARLDSARAKTIDPHNPRRLIRTLEIIYSTNAPVPKMPFRHLHTYRPIRANRSIDTMTPEVIKIGIRPPDDALKTRIAKRLRARMKQGMVKEVVRLHKNGLPAGRSLGGGLSWKRLDGFGLEYRFISHYLRGMLTKPQMMEAIEKESWRYAKRQMTWWKRDKDIRWVKNEREALAVVKKFLSRNATKALSQKVV